MKYFAIIMLLVFLTMLIVFTVASSILLLDYIVYSNIAQIIIMSIITMIFVICICGTLYFLIKLVDMEDIDE